MGALLALLALRLSFSPELSQGVSPSSRPGDASALPPWPLAVSAQRNAPSLSSIFTPEVQLWSSHLIRWADNFHLDPNLVATVMQIESCGHPRAVSSAGALGLFQVMPFHFSPTDLPFDPDTNARRGLAYLAQAFEYADGNVAHALAGYNGGLGVIGQPATWSAQTQRYVYYGTRIYVDAGRNVQTSPALQEWYRNYGRNLCQQARRAIDIP